MKSDIILLTHIAGAIGQIEKCLEKYGRDEFIQQAVERNIEIIGEAANKISMEAKDKYPHVPWQQIIAMRHRLIHHYYKTEDIFIWDVVDKDLPRLKGQIISILEDFKDD